MLSQDLLALTLIHVRAIWPQCDVDWSLFIKFWPSFWHLTGLGPLSLLLFMPVEMISVWSPVYSFESP